MSVAANEHTHIKVCTFSVSVLIKSKNEFSLKTKSIHETNEVAYVREKKKRDFCLCADSVEMNV